MGPAHERLDPDDLVGAQRHLGLEVGDDALLLQRPAQLAGERGPPGGGRVVLAMQLEGGSAAAGVLQGELGGAEQRLGVGAVPRVGRAPTLRLMSRLRSSTSTGSANAAASLWATSAHSSSSSIRGNEDAELVAAHPGRPCRWCAASPGAAGDLPEHEVAELVAERLVDLAEVDEVDEQDGGIRALPACGAQRVCEAVGEERAAGQARERVVHRVAPVAPRGAAPGPPTRDPGSGDQHREDGQRGIHVRV